MVSSEDELREIEMLEIPEDLSDTDSLSDEYQVVNAVTPSTSSNTDDNITTASSSPRSSSDETTISFIEQDHIELQEWLNSDAKFQFQFDERRYKHSVKHGGGVSVEFVNALFKIYENFSKAIAIDEESDDDNNSMFDEMIGVISGDYKSFKQERKHEKQIELTNAINKIIEVIIQRIDEEERKIENNESVIYEYHKLLAVLECLKANYFYESVVNRPELISNWINRIDPKPSMELVESIMINTPEPYLHPQFWNTYLSQLITRGLPSQAVNAIERSKFTHLQTTNPILFSVIEDFKTFLANYTSMSLKHQFNEWKLSCCEFRDSISKVKSQMSKDDNRHVIILHQIYDLLGILTGLPKTIANACEHWYEVYSAFALYKVRYDDTLYKGYFESSVSERPPAPESSENELDWDQICYNALNESFLKVLQSIDKVDSATSTYVSRIFELKGFLKDYRKSNHNNNDKDRRTVSEYLVSKYAYSCLNNHDLVPIGIGLLLDPTVFVSSQSKSDNRKTIAEFLPHFECKTNDDLEWSLTICAKLNLKSTSQALYLKFGEKSLKDGYLYEAMNMFVNCQTSSSGALGSSNPAVSYSNLGMEKVHHIVWELIFQDALVNNRPIKDELINNIVKKDVDTKFDIHPILKQCLSPYAVLFEFYKYLSTDPETALTKLRHLITFNFLPKKYYPLLLCQYFPFLVDPSYQFQLPQLIGIIEYIENYDAKADNEYEDGNTLYQYSISHIEKDASDRDWRLYLKENGKEIPKDVKSVIKSLRNEVVARIGRVYIED
ncbi:nucleoporin Nup85p [[Candida] railenensis]|uniref:Nuclear pore complex protein Nup85 n=1 Tax=[Candida] railenensis TaxID=45579 RepID=A0A9P0QNV5_9ASCO|nr:nucleoporin Nup85p [[Candida] railenensis]